MIITYLFYVESFSEDISKMGLLGVEVAQHTQQLAYPLDCQGKVFYFAGAKDDQRNGY
jgi:hypothetical protein